MGKIEIITGPMFSGKTTELMRRLERYWLADKKIILFKPEIDARISKRVVISSARQEFGIEVLTLYHPVGTDAEIIALDEAQFFPGWIVDFCQSLKDQSKLVIVCGLDMDARRQPFGMMGDLMAISDSVTKLTAVCSCGNDAVYSQLNYEAPVQEGNIILVGDRELYEARCHQCYTKSQSVLI